MIFYDKKDKKLNKKDKHNLQLFLMVLMEAPCWRLPLCLLGGMWERRLVHCLAAPQPGTHCPSHMKSLKVHQPANQ